MLDITNSSSEILILSPKEVIGILDLRSLGYHKIQQGVLWQNISKFYKFEPAENVCNQFNNLINTVKKEEKLETGEKYPWLDKTDRKILEKIYRFKTTHANAKKKKKLWICYINIRKLLV